MKYIEVHAKYYKKLERVSICVDQIVEVRELKSRTKSRTVVCFLLSDGFGYRQCVRCIESYDEVMTLIKSVKE